jgi:ABC-type multidrug transport system ATPase subunit
MKEKSLNAIVDFYALVAANSRIAGPQLMTNLVEAYLSVHFTAQTIELQMDRYAEKSMKYCDFRDQPECDWPAFFERELEALCYIISREAQAPDRLLVLLYLLELSPFLFVNPTREKDETIPSDPTPFFTKLGRLFHFSETALADCRSFIDERFLKIEGKNRVLCITGNQYLEIPEVIVEFHPQLRGQMIFLKIESLDTILYRVSGESHFDVNGHQIYKRRTNVLSKGALIQVDGISTIYYNDIEKSLSTYSYPVSLVLRAQGIEYDFPDGKKGLHELGFSVNGGELMAIMGGSGSGKTTLMNVLIGFLKPTKGEVLINSLVVHQNIDKLKGYIGYVPQDDTLLGELTAYENLHYNASLCLSNKSKEGLAETTDNLLRDLGLFEIRDLKVGSSGDKIISGGQRKRLNIAMELIRDPKILFLDEPTTGLSSSDSENIMHLLKKSTFNGKIVIINIHQPSSDIFKLFDKLLFLDHGGYPAYFGRAAQVISYLKRSMRIVDWQESECHTCGKLNPDDIFHLIQRPKIKLDNQEVQERLLSPQRWHRSFLRLWYGQHEEGLSYIGLPHLYLSLPNKFKQFNIFKNRNIRTKLADRQFIGLALLLAPLLAFVLSVFSRYSPNSVFGAYTYGRNENIPQFLLMSIIVALFMGMMSSSEEMIKDRGILKRESFLGLSFTSYTLSKIVFLFAVSAIQMWMYLKVSGMVLKIPHDGLTLFPILWVTACFANVLGLLMSSILKSAAAVYISIPFLLIPQILLSGAVINFDKINPYFSSSRYTPIVGDAMVAKWAYEAMAVDLFMANSYTQAFYTIDKQLNDLVYTKDFLLTELENVYYGSASSDDHHEWKGHRQLILSGFGLLLENGYLKNIEVCDLSKGSNAFSDYIDTCRKVLSDEVDKVH